MARPPRDSTSFGSDTYFVTASTFGHRALFQSERMARLFIDTLYHYRGEKKFLIHEFVLMRDHFHSLLSPALGTLPISMQLIKGGLSYRAKKELGLNLEIWERGYVEHRIRDSNDYACHLRYIYQNPVRAQLVAAPQEYPYSSAYPGFDLDPCPQGLKPVAVIVHERHG